MIAVFTAPVNFWSFNRKPILQEERLVDYRTVVTEWNDNINRILALLSIHFSDELRNVIDNEIGAEFVAIGRALEQAIRSEATPSTDKIEQRLNQLAAQVYNFNLRLLSEIRTRRHTLDKSA